MTKNRHIKGISGVSDPEFTPYESLGRIPWPVYSLLIALAVWGVFALFALNDPASGTVDKIDVVEVGKNDDSDSDISVGHILFNRFCATCHQQEGIGLAGAVPPLAGSSIVTGNPRLPVSIVLMGVAGPLTVDGTVFNGRMPTFRNSLTDQEIAAIVTYIRQAWQNNADSISSEEVASFRAELADDSAPLAGDQALKELEQTDTSTDPTDESDASGDKTTSTLSTVETARAEGR